MPYSVTLPAFAKINLSLRVLNRRVDGYHDLDTIFQTVSLHDTIELIATDTSEIIFSCDDRSLPTRSHNLVVRAATTLQSRFAAQAGATVRLIKRIPTHAGLGGGSSDAATTVIGLAHLWGLNLQPRELNEIAADLGADVPFFLSGGTARGTGRGDCVETLADAREKFFLIIKPRANIKTADAYKALDERSLTSKESKIILPTSEAKKVFDIQSFTSLHNDFEAIAFALEPEIERVKAALTDAGAEGALLAGSGSAVFAIFDSKDAQRRAIQAIKLETGWRVFPCRMVGRDEYRNAFGLASEILDRFTSN